MLIYIYIHTHRQRQYNIYTALLKQGRMFEESWGYFFGGGGGLIWEITTFPYWGGYQAHLYGLLLEATAHA